MSIRKKLIKTIGIVLISLLLIQVILPVVYAAEEGITTTKYYVKNNIIMKIDAETTVSEFLNNVSSNSGAKCAVYKGSTVAASTLNVATGMTLKAGETIYKMAVKGDANGDGKVSTIDLSLYKKHILALNSLTEPYSNAIDINCDGIISTVDGSQLKMILVGLGLVENETENPIQEITIVAEPTNKFTKEINVAVYWPENIENLTKQISINSGKTFSTYTKAVVVTENTTVVARLVNANSKIIKTATLTITNIDNVAPDTFEFETIHKITNYITLKGTTKDEQSGIAAYFFSADNGINWAPRAGQLTGAHTFMNIPANSKVDLRMKAVDAVNNEIITNPVSQRTFKTGMDILKERLVGVTFDEKQDTIVLADGRAFRLAITDSGSYIVRNLGSESEVQVQNKEEAALNEKVKAYELDKILTTKEIVEKLAAEQMGTIDTEAGTIRTENAECYYLYRVLENYNGKHYVAFTDKLIKNGLSASGQTLEVEAVQKIESIIAKMTKDNSITIDNVLNKAVEDKILHVENINRARGTFETEVGTAYQILKNPDNNYTVVFLGLAEEVENGIIQEKLLDEVRLGIIKQIIDWAIEDGETTLDKANVLDGTYQTTDNKYKQITVNIKEGTYKTETLDRPQDTTITYKATPNFPVMTNRVELEVTVLDRYGINSIVVSTEANPTYKEYKYTKRPTSAVENIDITDNGKYTVTVTNSAGRVTKKEILVSHISTLLPVKYAIIPETARNTAKTEIQNEVQTGPITVTIKYSDALLLENTDKYQYQIGSLDGEWKLAKKEQVITGITENCKIYARYFDGKKGLKLVTIYVDNVDNTAPAAFEATTNSSAHSITVDAFTSDEAKDSKGNIARAGVEGIREYLYKIDNKEWQKNSAFEDLKQNTEYTIFVKAVDHAGNSVDATNTGFKVRTQKVPNAADTITFKYSTTDMTNKNVKVKFISKQLESTSYKTQYQVINNNSQLQENAWLDGVEYETTENCKIYVRISDVTGQISTTGGYAIGNVTNIDKLEPEQVIPVQTAATSTSITINANNKNEGMAVDQPETETSASSGIKEYVYHLIPNKGAEIITAPTKSHTYTFNNLRNATLYELIVDVFDNVGNITRSEGIKVVTNAVVNKFAEATTTITGIKASATYNNPIIPAGFKPINTEGIEWGDGTTIPSGWNNGLVIEDKFGNQFVWVPVDGRDIEFKKWATNGVSYTDTISGKNTEDENAQIAKYHGFYVARYEAGKDGLNAMTRASTSTFTGVRYESAKQKSEAMIQTSSAKSGLITGTQWDTMLSWIKREKGDSFVKNNTRWGNFGSTKAFTANSEDWKVKNIYDILGNVQELTNELLGENVIVRGGAYNNKTTVDARVTYGKEYTNVNLGFRMVLYVVEAEEYIPEGDGILGIGNINQGPGNQTVNGGTPSYLNPVIPVGFMAINTDTARWSGAIYPSGWNSGLVIEDVNGNQFVWIPVDGRKVSYEKWYTIFAPQSLGASYIKGDDLPTPLHELGEEERAQIDKYGGFYIGRYEAGNEEGKLSSKAGMKPVAGITYAEARDYAEDMYNSAYVKSGLPTGKAWDTTTKWIAGTNGVNSVTRNWAGGNNYLANFTATGPYAIGPNMSGQMRGVYEEGTITKISGNKILIATGLVDQYKLNNIYDLAGNVWEYTSEYSVDMNNVQEYVGRGGDYYRSYPASESFGAGMRENIANPPGEVRNEGGFRVMLYLTQGTAEIGKFADYNRTINGEPARYNNPVIPAGFAPVNAGTNWGDGANIAPQWNDGLVIEDKARNQFVWVPVDTTTVAYQKWITRGISYQETQEDDIPEMVKTWKEQEKTQVSKYGGFYIARYEAGKAKDGTVVTNQGAETIINITYNDAKEKAESISTSHTVKSGIITGTAWDTVMKWIANEKGIPAVTDDSTKWGYYANSNSSAAVPAKNIFGLAGSYWEWTGESFGENYKVYRGGVYTDRGDSSPAGYRGANSMITTDDATSFRIMLYVTGDIVGFAKKTVRDSEPLKATEFPGTVNRPIVQTGMTPIKWNGSSWITTSESDTQWYDYTSSQSKWANARTPDGSMWVWLPRYAYKITYTNSQKISDGGKIDIIFLKDKTNRPIEKTSATIYAAENQQAGINTSNSYITHPAFTSNLNMGGWDKELSGMWFAKFESSGNDASTVGSKPNLASYGFDSGGHMFETAKDARLGLSGAEKSTMNTHMAKNSEWGAAAYLSYSDFGVAGKTVAAAANGIAGHKYDINVNQSTTGNIYGIYDMAGGRLEYTAGYFREVMGSRYSNLANIVSAPRREKQEYSGSGNEYYGDAMRETAGWQGSGCVYPDNFYKWWWENHECPARPLFVRSGSAMTGGADTIFTSSSQCANTNFAYAYRIILINEPVPDTIAPNSFELSVNSTTHNITVLGDTIDTGNTGTSSATVGVAGYQFKLDNGGWTPTVPSGYYTFNNLKQGTTHRISMKAIDRSGNETIATNSGISVKLASIPSGKENITMIATPNKVTNGNVRLKLSTDRGLKIQYQKDATNENGWVDYTSGENGFELSDNCTIYARLIDISRQGGAYTSIKIDDIDKVAPRDFELSTTSTTRSLTVKGSTIDEGSVGTAAENIGIVGYQFKLDSGKWTEIKQTGEYTFKRLKQKSTHTVSMKAIDKAGNEKIVVNPGTSIKLGEVKPATGNLEIIASPTGLTSGDVTIKLKTGTNMKMQYQKNATEENGWINYTEGFSGFTIGENCTIYARLIDEDEQGGNTVSINILNIDKVAPTANISSSNVEETSFTLNASGADQNPTATNAQSGIEKFEFYINNVLAQTVRTTSTSATVNTSGKTGGQNYTCYVKVYDIAGNVKQSEVVTVKTKSLELISSKAIPGEYVSNFVEGSLYWRVLTNNSGVVTLINVSRLDELTLTGKDGYNNGVRYLNDATKKYVNMYAESARSVCATDIEAMDKISTKVLQQEYWLATQGNYSVGEIIYYYGIRRAMSNGWTEYSSTLYFPETGKEESDTHAVRPIITLKSEVKVSSGDGSSGNPWELSL